MRAWEDDGDTTGGVFGAWTETSGFDSNWPLSEYEEKEFRDFVEEYPTKINYYFEGKEYLKNNIRLKMVIMYNKLLLSVSGYLPNGIRSKKRSK